MDEIKGKIEFEINKLKAFVILVVVDIVTNVLVFIFFKETVNDLNISMLIRSSVLPIVIGLLVIKWLIPVIYEKINMIHNEIVNDEGANFRICVPCKYKQINKKSIGGVLHLNDELIVFKTNSDETDPIVLDKAANIFYMEYKISRIIKFIHKKIPLYIKINPANKQYEIILPINNEIVSIIERFGIKQSPDNC